jgi:hypothetical protein
MPTLAGIPRRNILFFAALTVILAAIYVVMVQIPQSASARLEGMLNKAGFPDAKVGAITARPSAIIATDIQLDQDGFDRIGELRADLNWPSFFASGKISQLTIKKVSLTRTSDTLGSGGRQLVQMMLDLPTYRVALSDVTIDLNTRFGALRLTAEATVNSDNNPEDRDIKARIVAAQYQLGFDSNWEGSLKTDGTLELAGKLEGGRVNAGPLMISRFNGWMGLDVKGDDFSFQSQMEAGGASFLSIPLQNITLVNDHRIAGSSVITRAKISGIKDVMFTADYTREKESAAFVASLKGPSLGNLLDYVEETGGSRKTLRPALEQAGTFDARLIFQPDRRFVGGPLPFSVNVTADDGKILDGTMLFYPENFDVRGSLESQPAMVTALKDYFKIPSASINQNFIRLDGNSRALFQLQDTENQQ